MKLKNIMWKVKGINEVLSEFMTLFYLMMRILIVGVIGIVMTDHNIAIHGIFQFIMMAYMFYPVYIHYFNKLFYSTIIQGED